MTNHFKIFCLTKNFQKFFLKKNVSFRFFSGIVPNFVLGDVRLVGLRRLCTGHLLVRSGVHVIKPPLSYLAYCWIFDFTEFGILQTHHCQNWVCQTSSLIFVFKKVISPNFASFFNTCKSLLGWVHHEAAQAWFFQRTVGYPWKVCQIFDFTDCIWWKVVEFIFPFKLIHRSQPWGSQ